VRPTGLRTRLCLVFAVLLTTVGCGSDYVPLAEVEGTVTLDGKPLEGAEVQFVPEPGKAVIAPRSTGRTNEQGQFKLVCDDGRSGAMLGEHRVAVMDLKAYGDTPPSVEKGARYESADALPQPKFRFGQIYSDLTRTPLRKEVKAGKQTIDVELKSSP
jgi:hypothetical protein